MNYAVVPQLLVALVVVVVAAWLFGALARSLGQPAVVGEMAAGITLGPTLLHGAITKAVFPADVRPALAMLATIGVCLFMFLVGLHLDRELLRGQGRTAATVSLGAVLLPLGLGVLLALYVAGPHPRGGRLAFALFMGTAMSITAFPVLARILSGNGLIRTPIGGLALACAALDDVLAWSLLAAVVAIAGGRGDPWRVILVVPFAAVLLTIVRPLLARLARRGRHLNTAACSGVLAAGAVGLALCAGATDWMGLHPIFGAFLFGVTMPRDGVPPRCARVLPRVEKVNSLVLLPVFFLIVGLKVDLSQLNLGRLAQLALILAVAICGKGIGAYAGARVCGARPRHASILAALVNARGVTELVVLTVGLQLGLIGPDLYSLMVVMAFATTAMTGVLLRLLHAAGETGRDVTARSAAAAVVATTPARNAGPPASGAPQPDR